MKLLPMQKLKKLVFRPHIACMPQDIFLLPFRNGNSYTRHE